MATEPLDSRRQADLQAISPESAAADRAASIRGLSRLLDSAVRIPGTNIRFGIDSIVGLVPGVGDVATAAISGYIILSAARVGAPASVLTRMLLNLGTDTLVGAIPVLGDLFDVAFKANVRNVALLEKHLGQPVATKRASRGAVVVVIGGVVILVAGAVLLAIGVAKLLNTLI